MFGNLVPPAYILTKANNDRMHVIECTEKKYFLKFNAPDVIQFKTYMLIDEMKNLAYDSIVEGKFIEVDGLGRFIISNITTESKGNNFEYKDCEAIGIEVMLGQKYLELFTINMGTTESIDGVKFYNLANPDKSLLHLALEKCPGWKIGHIDTSLLTMERCFEITRQDIYSFLTQDVANAFQCIFLFDTLHQIINVYAEDTVGNNTDIFVTYDNLLKNTNISSSVDDIKTCLTVTGANDLSLREVNMGYDKIYMLDYYNSLEFMSHGLYDAYNKWVKKWNGSISTYSSLLSQYQNYYNQINDLTNKKMPSNPDSTNWAEYGLVPLQEKLKAYEQRQAIMIKAGQGDKNHKDYNNLYLPVFNAINAIKTQIAIVENQLSSLKSQQSSIGTQMNNIISSIDMKNNFSTNQLEELDKFIREDELSSSNFVVTDTMTDSERMDMLKEMLGFGQKELRKVSQPQLQFSADMLNLFKMDEFKNCSASFEPGNYINIIIRDDYIVKARLLTIDVDFYHPDNFSVTFGNLNKVKGKNIYTDTMDALDTAASVATTVSFNSSNWNKANKEADNISQIISGGLLASGNYLKNGDDSELVIDGRGIFVNTTSGKYANMDSVFLGGGRLLFTDDNWKTVSMSVGRADVTIKGQTESRFGTFADFVLAGYIGGSTIEGTEIYGGILQSQNYLAGKTGTRIDLNKGIFEFNANGESKLTLDENGILTVKGTVKAEKGWIGGKNAFSIEDGKIYCQKNSLASNANGVYIGVDGIALGANNVLKMTSDGTFYAEKGYLGGTNGFVLEKNKLYNGKSSIADAANGIYLGTDGIALGANSLFKVTPHGYITAKSGEIGGAIIQNDSIRASNENWWINSNGQASFEDVYISGVRNNSSFGSIGYNNGVTWGNFNGSSYFSSNVGSPFGGTCISHIQSISADHIRVNYLDAMNTDIGNLKAKDAEIEQLVAKKANVEDLNAYRLKATKITAEELTFQGRNTDWKRVKIVIGTVNKFTPVTNIHGEVVQVLKEVNVKTEFAYIMSAE
ncbi:hypothetical protein D3Z45_21650 [Lachnospiraceae bacterium]|nr:hypothetical protein [Lachnospiraceae bacterium]